MYTYVCILFYLFNDAVRVCHIRTPHLISESHRVAVRLRRAAAPLPDNHRLGEYFWRGRAEVLGRPRTQLSRRGGGEFNPAASLPLICIYL